MRDNILNPVYALIKIYMPKAYTADVELVFGSLTEIQEDNFKIIINFFWKKGISEAEKLKEDATGQRWVHNISQRIHQLYGDGVLTSLNLQALSIKK